ncbi:NlpC/P60 family protein [Streptomyces sp. NPDC052701]|uniref:NlpC/P60 family protein n=1 Tax=Streptomyces sp. NPDC052701 TaxID=3155533 RepID=UPI003418CAAA
METPVFEEFEPASDCDCPGCAHRRRIPPRFPAGRAGGPPASCRALVVAAASAALGAGHAVPVAATSHAPHSPGVPAGEEPGTPQGGAAPLHGPGGRPAKPAGPLETPAITRAEIIDRAGTWVAAKVPYSTQAYWSDGYRQDCSGYVSMAWKLPGNEWTGSLHQYADRISEEELQPGDILLFHHQADPANGSHVVVFGGWTDHTHTSYLAYEQTRPHTRRQTTPYAYWNQSDRYVPYRYKGLAGSAKGAPPASAPPAAATPAPYPGRAYSGPGAHTGYATRPGRRPAGEGPGAHRTTGPGPRRGAADRREAGAFPRVRGRRGGAADGFPGPRPRWRLSS